MDDWSHNNIAALSQAEQTLSPRNAGPTAAQILLKMARCLTLFRTADDQPFASGLIGKRRETWPIPSKSLRMWLIRQFVLDQHKPPPSQALHDVLQVLESQALDSNSCPVFLRVGSDSSHVYLDLADEQRRVVAITSAGWRVEENPRVHFIRPQRSLPLPCPALNGSLGSLRELLNLQKEDDWQLLLGWLLGALRPEGPYPILVLQGEQGSAKSTVARILKYLIDPSTSLLRTAPGDERDLLIAARHAHVLAFDNLSGVQPWFSDALCRLATGGGFATRELYSNTEETVLHAQRPVILNGIDDLATRQDLIDRAIVITLSPIPESARRQDRELWERITKIRPDVLGAFLNAVQSSVANHRSVILPALPRMADFAVWVTAAESTLGWESGSFLRAYRRNRGEAIELGLESSPIASHIRMSLDRQPRWQGTASELLELVKSGKSEIEQRSRIMPQNPQAMRNHLNRLAPALRAIGINMVFDQRTAGKRLIMIEKTTEIPVTAVTRVTRTDDHDQQEANLPAISQQSDSGDSSDNTNQVLSGRGFPPEIPGLGRMRREAIGRCVHCDQLTSFAYGGMHLCCTHARSEVIPPHKAEPSSSDHEESKKDLNEGRK